MEDYIRKGARKFASLPFLLELRMPWTIQPPHILIEGAMVLDSIAIDIISPR